MRSMTDTELEELKAALEGGLLIKNAKSTTVIPASLIASLIARLEAAEAGWQDISAAPTEGEFLAERQATGDWLKVQRHPLYPGHDAVVHAHTGLLWSPKRWRPLPAPPAKSED